MRSRPQLQNEYAVAYRALCLGALLRRSELELNIQELNQFTVFDAVRDEVLNRQYQLNARLLRWIEREALHPHLTKTERLWIDAPLGTWSERTLVTVTWQVESLGMLLWALNWLDKLPEYDEQFDPEPVLNPLEILTPTIDFIWSAQLRSRDELNSLRDQAELWNWRSRATELERMGVRPPEGVTFQEIIRETAERAYRNGHLATTIGGDFPVYGKAYADLSEDEFTIASAIAYERYAAVNWMCELPNTWENILADF